MQAIGSCARMILSVSHDGELDVTVAQDAYLIDVPEGETVDVEVTGESDVFIIVWDLVGNLVVRVDETSTGSENLSLVVRDDGPYVLFVEQYSAEAAEYELTSSHEIARLSDPDDGTTLVFGEPVVGVLDTTADHDYFFVELNAGDTIVIDARSAALDPRVFAGTDTTGLRFLQGDDDGGRGLLELDARLIYTAGQTGRHVILVADARHTRSAGYLLTVNGEVPVEDSNVYRIGVMEALTGPGETYGNVSNRAKQLAMEEINEAGGINGAQLELVVEDSKCNAQDAITAYNKLTDVDDIKIILGTSCSGAMLGVARLAEEDGVVLFSSSATNPEIANAGDYIFRNAISDEKLGIETGNLLRADGIQSLATISESTDYAEGVRRGVTERFEALGGQIVGSERYQTDTLDFRTQLTLLRESNPDALLIAAQAEASAGSIIKQAREIGYDGPIYGEVVSIGATSLEVAGEAATGLKAVIADLDPGVSKGQSVLQDFRARYGYVTLPWYLGSAYDSVYIAAECLMETEDDQDADAFRDCLYNVTWSGAIGNNYSFDQRGEVVGLSNVVIEILPVAERNEENQGYRVLGPAPA